MISSFPKWKYTLLAVVLLISLIYALPNVYGEDPAIQISGLKGKVLSDFEKSNIEKIIKENNYSYKSLEFIDSDLLIRFNSTETQLQAQAKLQEVLGRNNYSIAVNLAPVTPNWLSSLGGKPMKLGLDLRGGVRFLMDVDVQSSLDRNLEANYADLRAGLRQENIRYKNIYKKQNEIITIIFESKEIESKAYNYIANNFPQLEIMETEVSAAPAINVRLSVASITDIRNYTLEQTISTLRNRVNELGVAEAVVQRQGQNRVVVELPGIQDTARAKDILGKTATIEFVMVDHDNNAAQAMHGRMPVGSKIVMDKNNNPVLVKKRVILSGESITGATSSYSQEDGSPIVSIRIGGSGTNLFKSTTMKNINKAMAVIYKETTIENNKIKVSELAISVATIQSALSNNFQISGLSLMEARDLALLLRSGTMPTALSVAEESIIGPTMGQENIRMGMISIVVGLCLVLLFMVFYYSLFGLIANLALVFNLVLLVACMSLIGATLTLPGIAGIVLTLGMAIDANVLIFERIREELRTGMSPQASIVRGFEHAFTTIVDANLTTLIVGLILFAIGSGPVKGFAVTLSIGILTSMFTAITGTRAMISLIYSEKCKFKTVLVGI